MDIQTAIVAVIVSVSALYLVRHWLRMLQGKTTGCHSGCSGCPHNKACPSVAACEAETRKSKAPVES